MNRLDTMLAPRALTSREVAEVLSPHLIVYGIAHRAFIHAETLQDDTRLEAAVVSASEEALAAIADAGLKSVGQWLSDMESDREPRFYRKGALADVVYALCREAAQAFCRREDEKQVALLADLITDRDRVTLEMLIRASGTTDA
jgi:hypothetical protein